MAALVQLTFLSPFQSGWGLSPGDGTTHIQAGSFLLKQSSLETPTHPQMCLPGDPKAGQVASETQP